MNCCKCKWLGTCEKCTGFVKKSEYQQIDRMTDKEKWIERQWLENIVKEMLEDG